MEQTILAELIQRGVPLHIARGMVANMIAESRLDPGINEIAPLVPGSRGGYGLNQWTGPRRRQYEAFAAERGAPLDDLDTQLDFTLWELQNTESRAWNALQSAADEVEAARIYSEKFLRPGIPHMENRLAHARRLAGVNPGTASEATPQNTLAMQSAQPQAPSFQYQMTPLDPAAFMRQRNALAPQPIMVNTYGA